MGSSAAALRLLGVALEHVDIQCTGTSGLVASLGIEHSQDHGAQELEDPILYKITGGQG